MMPPQQGTVIGTVPRLKTYRIVGLFEVGMFEYDNTFLYVPLSAAQVFFRLPERVNAIEIFVADPDEVSAIKQRIAGVRVREQQQGEQGGTKAVERWANLAVQPARDAEDPAAQEKRHSE